MCMAAAWAEWFHKAGVDRTQASSYAKLFHRENIHPDHLDQIDSSTLQEIGIQKVGDKLGIMKMIKSGVHPEDNSPTTSTTTTTNKGPKKGIRGRGVARTLYADMMTPSAEAAPKRAASTTTKPKWAQTKQAYMETDTTASDGQRRSTRKQKVMVVGGMRSEEMANKPDFSARNRSASENNKGSVLERLQTKTGGTATGGKTKQDRTVRENKGKSIKRRLSNTHFGEPKTKSIMARLQRV